MIDPRNIQRRAFLKLTIGTFGAVVTVRGENIPKLRAVSLGEAHKGTLEIDLRIMNQFKQQPQELLDFYVACRKALTGKNPESAVSAVCKEFNRSKLGGPMLGDITTTGVAVWMHLPEPDTVTVVVTPEGGGDSKAFKSDASERILSVRCEGLSADSPYVYEVTNSKGEKLGEGRFVTTTEKLSEEPFRISFGADFHKIGMYRPELLRLAQERGSRAMLLIGDLAVDGRKVDFDMINVDYMLRNLSPVMQRLMANVPVTATWDDHDYWGNDTSGIGTRQIPIDVEGLRSSWKKHWNNPEGDLKRDGIYFQTQIGPVHYIALDTRSCRVNAEQGKANSFLGLEQMVWLKEQIMGSTSPFIVISSGTMWSDNISKGKDSWGTWDPEGREEIFQWIESKEDAQVILLSGDRHGARGFAIPRPNGGKIYELEVGTLGGVSGPGAFGDNKQEQIFGYKARTWAIGELEFQVEKGAPQARFRLFDEKGTELESILLEP